LNKSQFGIIRVWMS